MLCGVLYVSKKVTILSQKGKPFFITRGPRLILIHSSSRIKTVLNSAIAVGSVPVIIVPSLSTGHQNPEREAGKFIYIEDPDGYVIQLEPREEGKCGG